MSIDAETNGLWGHPFAIAAIVYDEYGNDFARFVGRLSDDKVTNQWVKENVLPTLQNLPVTHDTDHFGLLSDFANFYMKYKDNCNIICHMGYIVEAWLFRILNTTGIISDWDAPYPLYDISSILLFKGEDATSVDKYAEKYGLKITDYGSTHNPLYDCEVTFRVYEHLMSNK